MDRAVGEEHVRPARVPAPVVLDVGLGVVDRARWVFQSARSHDLGPALLGRGVELIGPSLDQRRLAEPAVDRSGHPGDIAQVVAPLADDDRVTQAVGDGSDLRSAVAVEDPGVLALNKWGLTVIVDSVRGAGLGADLTEAPHPDVVAPRQLIDD